MIKLIFGWFAASYLFLIGLSVYAAFDLWRMGNYEWIRLAFGVWVLISGGLVSWYGVPDHAKSQIWKRNA